MTDAGHINNNFDDPLDEPFFCWQDQAKIQFCLFFKILWAKNT